LDEGGDFVKKIVAAGLLAFGGLMTTAVCNANADEIQVEGNYATLAACQADGPHVEVNVPGNWTHYSCVQHSDGLWYLYLSN
jgi:hypothetical protein